MENINNYNYKIPLNNLMNFALEHSLFQMINFTTWSRVINGVKKESVLDHVYVNCAAIIKNITSIEPTFGDHLLII